MQSRLTESQRAAVEHFEGPLLVLAGPGSGKTRVITHRIARLIERGVSPRHILGLTFTNKAAGEMAHRVGDLVPGARVWVSTFHRFCARLLRENSELVGLKPNFSIFDTDDQRAAIKQVLETLNLDKTQYAPARIGGVISRMKNDLVTLDALETARREATLDFQTVVVSRVLPDYQKLLLTSNAVDFDDLLLHVVALLRDNPHIRSEIDRQYRFILVDEYQDTNLAQYELIRALSHDVPNLCATGDPDQSIYGWRGARIDNILRFEKDFPNTTVVKLEDNFRSTKAILRAADSLIEHNQQRKQKRLRTENEEGDAVRLHRFWNGQQEATELASQIRAAIDDGVWRANDIAIVYRVNWLSREIELALSRNRIPYQVAAGLAFYERAEVKDLLSYLRAIENPADRAAMLRIINKPTRGIGKGTLDKLVTFADRHELTLLNAAENSRQIPDVSAGGVKSLLAFAEMMQGFRDKAAGPVAELLRSILAETGYGDDWQSSDDEQEQQRFGNITELILSAKQFDEEVGSDRSLQAFLETTALVSDTDAVDPDSGSVTLMTMHAAKGLEFPVVYIVGFEQNLIPHERALSDRDDFRRALFALEEERRLLFVAITRAMKQLHLTQCVERYSFGRPLRTLPSQFQSEFEFEEQDYLDQNPLAVKLFGGRPNFDPDSQVSPHDDFTDFDFGANAATVGQASSLTSNRLDSALNESTSEAAWASSNQPESLPDSSNSTATRSAKARALLGQVTTGAALLEAKSSDRATAAPFQLGQQVRHPRYGLGTVVELGRMMKRITVTVDFGNEARETFVADKAPLSVVGIT